MRQRIAAFYRSRPKKGGPPFTDIAGRARSLVWYQFIKGKTAYDDAQLDAKYVRQGRTAEPTRAFTQIRRNAVDPGWEDGTGERRDFNLVDALAKDFKGSRELYESHLWILFSPVAPTSAKISEIIDGLITKLGLFRSSDIAPREASPSLKKHAAFRPYPAPEYRQSLVALTKEATADHIALLGALYLEAINETALEQALLLRDLLREALQRFIADNNIHGLAKCLLITLMEDRLIARRWESRDQVEAAKQALEEDLARSRRNQKPLRGFMFIAHAFLLFKRRRRPADFPLVPRTGVLKPLKPGSKALEAFMKEQDRDYWYRRVYSGEGPVQVTEAFDALNEFFSRPAAHNKRKNRNELDVPKR